jgi:uncharacterized membrane protein YfcA
MVMWYGLAALGAVLTGFSKTGLPGCGILIVPLMAMLFPAKQSVGVLLPMLLVGDLFAVFSYRRHAEWNRLWRLLPWVVAGILGGVLVLRQVDSIQLKPGLGVLVLGLLAVELLRDRFGWSALGNRPWLTMLAGTLAGFSSTVGNVAGPVMSIYLISAGLPKNGFMGTFSWLFLILNSLKVPFYVGLDMISLETLRFNLVVTPLIICGAFVGKRALRWISQQLFNRLLLILAGLAALRLIID